jgi:YidC/Oxa1 family membrane protein insertase
MEHIVEFLETLFGPLIDVFGNALEFFHTMGAPWWLSIAILTVIVRSLLFPLTIKQVKSMRAMQDLKPEMDRLRAKYKDNKQRQQEELMKLYQERKVNPLGGCLPLLVQMPIFITMYYVIRSFDQTHPSFASGGILWFKDLTVGDPFYILPVLSAVTMLAASEITAKNVDPQQRWLMRLLPVVQNYLIYNHGPGRKVAASSPNEKRAPRNESNAAPEPAPKPQNSSSTPGGRAKAREARRRRRKKRR